MDIDLIKQRFASLEPFLNERLRRLYAAAEAKTSDSRKVHLVV